MSFTTIVDAAVTTLTKHADYNTGNTRHGDSTMLAGGLTRAALLSYGGLTVSQWSLSHLLYTWTINIDLMVLWAGSMVAFETSLATERQKVIDTFAAWPALVAATGVQGAFIALGNEPDLISERGGAYRGERLLLTVEEVVDASRSE